jgi:hypothetical protein
MKRIAYCAAAVGVTMATAGAASWWLRNNKRKWTRYDLSTLTQPMHKERPSGLLFDLHCHTNASSDGVLSPEELVRWYIANGYDGIAVTDHNTIANVRAVQLAAPPSLVVIPGMEWTTFRCHMNILGVPVGRWDTAPRVLFDDRFVRYPSIAEIGQVCDWAHLEGGIVQYNHPNDPSCVGLTSDEILHAGFDCVEVVSGLLDLRGDQGLMNFCKTHNMVITGGSDTHEPGATPLVYNRIKDGPGDILQRIKRGDITDIYRQDPPPFKKWENAAVSIFVGSVEALLYPVKQPFKMAFPMRKPRYPL